jgi:cytochrome P450
MVAEGRLAMLVSAVPIVPPAPKVHAKDMPVWRSLPAFYRNTLSTLPHHAFDVLISRRRVLGIDSMLLNDPEGIRHVLVTAIAKYKRPVVSYRVLRPVAGNSVLLAEGAEWRRQRRILAPIFTPSDVGLLLPHFAAAATGLVKRIEGKKRANLSKAFQDVTLDAVLRGLFSLAGRELRERLQALGRDYPGRPTILDGLARTETAFAFATRRRQKFRSAWNAEVDELIKLRRGAPSGQHTDLLDVLLAARDPETGEALSNEEARDQCGTMLAAGSETTARLLFWATYLLTLDQGQQDRLRAEIAAFPPGRVSKLDDLLNWPRIRETLLESLRLYPPLAHIVREAITDDVVVDQRVTPGTFVWISPWVLHRHRKFWTQPTAFIPDRFASKPASWTNNGAFMPFGAGPRICLGATFALAEAQIVLATLLSHFKMTLDDRRAVMPVGTVTVAPCHEPRFQLEAI